MARVIDAVVGHRAPIELLQQMRNQRRWPHALLFVGPAGAGKRKIALACAQALVCEDQENQWGCGECGSCRRIEKQQSESLTIVEPDRSLTKPNIKVEQVRTLLEELSLKAVHRSRVVIIDEAHLMNAQAANALLKELEEPAENVFFILLATDLNQLLPTIRSRVQAIRFSALSYEEIKKVKPGCADWMYRSSRGRMDRLLTLSGEEGLVERAESLSLLDQFCFDVDFIKDKNWKDTAKDRVWALRCIAQWQQLLRDVVVLKSQAGRFILNTDQGELLKKLGSLPLFRLAWLFQRLLQAEREISGNADAVLTFEDIWIGYARLD